MWNFFIFTCCLWNRIILFDSPVFWDSGPPVLTKSSLCLWCCIETRLNYVQSKLQFCQDHCSQRRLISPSAVIHIWSHGSVLWTPLCSYVEDAWKAEGERTAARLQQRTEQAWLTKETMLIKSDIDGRSWGGFMWAANVCMLKEMNYGRCIRQLVWHLSSHLIDYTHFDLV